MTLLALMQKAQQFDRNARLGQERGTITSLRDATKLFISAAECWRLGSQGAPPDDRRWALHKAETACRAGATCLDRIADLLSREAEQTEGDPS